MFLDKCSDNNGAALIGWVVNLPAWYLSKRSSCISLLENSWRPKTNQEQVPYLIITRTTI